MLSRSRRAQALLQLETREALVPWHCFPSVAAAAETATQTNLQAVHQNTLSNPICQTEMTAILKVFERDGHRI